MTPPTLAHVVQPCRVSRESDLQAAQPITFETMRRAKAYAARAGITVDLYATAFADEPEVVPDGFAATKPLTRSVGDVGSFNRTRKLPLIADILGNLHEASDADYFIYTNVDIGVLPNFYEVVAHLIDHGYDSFVINRRTLKKEAVSPEHIPLLYAEAGESHPGSDCFIFKKSHCARFQLGNICIGAAGIGRLLAINMLAYAKNFREFKDLHVTFHVGDDQTWKSATYDDYQAHNRKESVGIVELYKRQGLLADHEIARSWVELLEAEGWLGAGPTVSRKRESRLRQLKRLWKKVV